jgi:hypothetical protein
MNMAIPGTGTLLSGRVVGYAQLVIYFLALTLTLIFGLRFIIWCLNNWSRIYGDQSDIYNTWSEIWQKLKWALVGIGTFLISWVWALASSLAILAESKEVKQ